MNRTIEDIQKDIELLGIKGGYDIEQLLTPQDCRRLSYEIERLNNIIKELEKDLYDNAERCKDNFNETQDIKWLDFIEIYKCIADKLKDVLLINYKN